MTEIGVSEARNQLSALLDRVERGEEIVITRHGRPIVPTRGRRLPSALQRMRDRAVQAGPEAFHWDALKSDRD